MASYCVRVTCNYDILFLFFIPKTMMIKSSFLWKAPKQEKL